MIKINLELAGYRVVQALDGVKGFALAKQELPSLVILDVMLPEESGIDVLKKIRSNPAIEKLPVIMETAKTNDEDTAAIINA